MVSDHTIEVIWVIKCFFVQFCVFLPCLLNIFCFSLVLDIFVLYCANLCMKLSLGISNFLEEITSLSYSVVLPYFFALFASEVFSLLAILWNSALSWEYLSLSPLPFTSLLFSTICKASSDNHFTFFHFCFFVMVLVITSCTMLQTSIHISSDSLSMRSYPLNLFITSTVEL